MVVRPSAPRYAVFSTNDQERTSPDRIAFTLAASPLAQVPQWWFGYNATGHSWSPDVSFHNGTYWMYYSVSSWGVNRSAIGLATSPSGDPGTRVDQGIVFGSTVTKSYNAIDPALLVDSSGRWWLTFGSFWKGIYQVELNPSTGKLLSATPTPIHLAERPAVLNDPIEGAYVMQHGAYYYLFASFDYCCQSVNSTYNVRVGRSTSPNGPYVDAAGVKMLNGGGTKILASHGSVVGPGGESVVHDNGDGNDLLVYHYYDANAGGVAALGINFLGWNSAGWPYVW
jgi:arabinan endo-1,5-alpha-L-arabinosidase